MGLTDRKKRGARGLHVVLPLSLALVCVTTLAADNLSSGNPEKGARSWADNCARCHNLRSPSDLRDDQWVTSVFHMRVRAGLTGAEARDIIEFLQDSNSQAVTGEQQPVASIGHLTGEAIYKGTCTACHGSDGKGALPGVPDFTSPTGPLIKPDSELLKDVIRGVQNGDGKLPMPPHGGNHQLTDQDMAVVLRYIKKRFDPGLHNE